jgi:hypothetical protein
VDEVTDRRVAGRAHARAVRSELRPEVERLRLPFRLSAEALVIDDDPPDGCFEQKVDRAVDASRAL